MKNMKKIIMTLTLIIVTVYANPAHALSVKVASMQDFTSENPTETMKVITLEPAEFKNGLKLPEGTVIKGEIYDVKGPKRGKLNASFRFKPIYYSYNGQKKEITDDVLVAKYAPYKELDKAELAISAVSTAGSMFLKIPGFGQAVSFTKGAIKDPDNNRLKSGAKQIYKDSFLSYVEEGKEIVLKKDEMFILKFKLKDEPDEEEQAPVEEKKENSTEVPIESIPVNQIAPPTASPTTQTTPMEKTTTPIHSVDPYEVLKEVESVQQQ